MTESPSGLRAKTGLPRARAGRAGIAAWERWRRLRQLWQVLSLGLFLFLLLASSQRPALLAQTDLFFRLDPLAALAAMLAGRAWIPRLALAVGTVALTILLGRVWCGWLCPLGTILEWASFRGARQRERSLSPR
ncbi:MAG: 4Fe-4S binding protein, partial [Anaerolineae bacterium]|nr:4Fe-4S binding protein [Anaerolineae bacterium]